MSESGYSIWSPGYGANLGPDGNAIFRVWAPNAGTVDLRLWANPARTVPMRRTERGTFEAVLSGISAGTDYAYILDGEKERPDPVSRYQPSGVYGPSRVVDPRDFEWSDSGWQGIPLREFILYELHTGTFTEEGTFEAVIEKIPYLRDLGVTAIELMPVAEFPGGRNWGYDGVCLYSPNSGYGGPVGLKRLVDACHGEGMAFVLDVVYNHLGPEGDYLAEFGPYFTGRYTTPWGSAINFDGPGSDGVRRYFVENALYWLTEYHVDALRLDAIHGIFDFSAKHILQEISENYHGQAEALGRRSWLIAESDLNDVRLIRPIYEGGHGMDAQWSDDFHHALHAVVTDARYGYFADFGRVADLKKALVEGFVLDGSRRSAFRGRRHGSSSVGRPGEQFVVCIQNHDQVANGSLGRRLGSLVSRELEKLAGMVTLCAPNLPLLFMGQEYGETAPFDYFTSFEDSELAEAVRRGRREEFSGFGYDRDFADPQAEETYLRCKLNWDSINVEPHSGILRFFRDMIALRRRLGPLSQAYKDLTQVQFSEESRWMTLRRGDPSGARAVLHCNFDERAQEIPVGFDDLGLKRLIWSGEQDYGGDPQSTAPAPVLERGEKLLLAGGTGVIYGRD